MDRRVPQDIRLRIIELWQSGTTSGEIGRIVGKTRSAVMGVIDREKKKGAELRGHISKPKKEIVEKKIEVEPVKEKVEIMPVKTPEKIISFFERRKPAAERRNIRIFELENSSCRYIVAGEGVNSIFCGDRKVGRTYCPAHMALCYIPVKRATK